MASPSDFDWNLIKNLDALLREQNVSRAAERVGLTQSAMSRALARLRVVFGDELFVRHGSGIEPTLAAESLRSQIYQLCEGMTRVAEASRPFQPNTAQRHFVVASADYAEWLILPQLVALLQREAPAISLTFQRATKRTAELLQEPDVDLVIGPRRGDDASWKSRVLFREEFCCVVRAEHPRLGGRKRLTLDAYCREAHLLIAPRGLPGGVVDQELRKLGRSRRVAAHVPTFLVAPALVSNSDLIATLPRRLAAAHINTHGLRVLSPPLDVPGFSMQLAWHPKRHADAGHQYLRRSIASLFPTPTGPHKTPSLRDED